MLVWISKGFIDVRTDVCSIFTDDSKESVNLYGIELRNGFSDDERMLINYDHRDVRDADFQLLKDCIVSLKVRNNVLMYNPPNGTLATENNTGSRRNGSRDGGMVRVDESSLVVSRADLLRSQLNVNTTLFSSPPPDSLSYSMQANGSQIGPTLVMSAAEDDDTIPF